MKVQYIILLVIAAVLTGIVLYTYGDATTYTTFSEAMKNQGKKYHVVGELDRSKEMKYDPKVDPNYFEFYLKDSLNNTSKVVYNNAKPQDFEKSAKVVVNGHYEKDYFLAKEILLKCPSKYNDAGMQAATN